MARSLTSRSTNPKIMDDNIKILDDALSAASTPSAEDVSYDNTDSGLTADDVQGAIDEVLEKIQPLTVLNTELGESTGWSETIPFPTGYTMNNTYILGLLIEDANGWRSAFEGLSAETTERLFPEINASGIRVYNNISTYYSKAVKVVVVKL